MRLLALEAGGARLSAAAYEDGALLASSSEEAERRQTERLAPLVEALLSRLAWRPERLDALACGRGPGSFTGLRSSLAFGEGLAAALPGLRLLGVDTLPAWAQACAQAEPRAAVALDGRREHCFFGRFERIPGGWRALEEPGLLALGEARARLEGLPVASDLEPGLFPGARLLAPPQGAALAEAVGALAGAEAETAARGSCSRWEPLYLRQAEAERLWRMLHPKA